MKLVNQTVGVRIGIVVVGIGIAGTLAAGVASAADTSSAVPGSTCTVGQAEATLAAQDPADYAKIMKYSDSSAELANVLALSPAGRADYWDQVRPTDADNRQMFLGVHGWSENERHAAEAAIDTAATTCRA
ncbi:MULTISPECIES: hypothetical protein [unclassified Gordonia (in: high G+C Gram-positive bacteria)]